MRQVARYASASVIQSGRLLYCLTAKPIPVADCQLIVTIVDYKHLYREKLPGRGKPCQHYPHTGDNQKGVGYLEGNIVFQEQLLCQAHPLTKPANAIRCVEVSNLHQYIIVVEHVDGNYGLQIFQERGG